MAYGRSQPSTHPIPARPYLHASMLELLFEPSEVLAQRHQEADGPMALALVGRDLEWDLNFWLMFL